MRSLTFNQKRLVAGIWLVVFLFALGNEYLEWDVFGGSAKIIRSIVMFIGILGIAGFGPRMISEMEAPVAAKREAERVAELERDRSNDAADDRQLRRSLGMPLDTTKSAAAQQSAPEDALKQRASER